MELDDRLRSLASAQFGVVSRGQAAGLGLDRFALDHRLRRGEWLALSPRVLRASATPDHPMLTAMAGVLDVGGAATVCRTSAASVWGLPGYRVDPVHVLREHGLHPSADRLAVVHTSRAVPASHIGSVDGLALTTPLRTIFDLAGSQHPGRTERLLDSAVGRGLCTYRGVHQMLADFGRRGRAGIEVMRELAADRPPGERPPESGLEARVNQILIRAGQRPLDRQVDLGDDDHWVGRFDLVDRGDNFVLEVQSDTYHGSVLDRRRDAERRAELEAAGWVVAEALEFDIWHRPEVVVQTVRTGRRRGRAALRASGPELVAMP
jgi:hypothetical protein